MNEHEYEPVKGLPEELPDDEHIVWQGSPKWQSLAVRAFHVRKVVIYFSLLLGLSVASSFTGNSSIAVALPSIKILLLLAGSAVAILLCLAIAYSRSTVYTVTNRRIVLRFGVAVQMMINIPWEKVVKAGLRDHADGTGDLVIETDGSERLSYWILWPNARPWRLSRAQPLLRSLADAHVAGAQISRLLQQHVEIQRDSEPRATTSTGSLATSA